MLKLIINTHFLAFPNPSKGIVNISNSDQKIKEIVIYNIYGEIINSIEKHTSLYLNSTFLKITQELFYDEFFRKRFS